ncbi:hypothetical protein [Cupriavidus sp. WS]|uniref:hypothetical protein n=1 Tax=Cupriavidus sp. WS TaxID=1312922 RepID=UPI0012DC5E1F|nr:hypothetical protein [Cupriavidus sp. WS]
MMKVAGRIGAAAVLAVLCVSLSHAAPNASTEKEAALCARVISSGAAEIVKGALRLKTRLPTVREADARRFASYAPGGVSPPLPVASRPQYYVWLIRHQLETVAGRTGRVPAQSNPADRALRVIDNANGAQGHIALAMKALAYASTFRGHERDSGADALAVLTEDQVRIYAGDLEALSVALSLLISCHLRRPQ